MGRPVFQSLPVTPIHTHPNRELLSQLKNECQALGAGDGSYKLPAPPIIGEWKAFADQLTWKLHTSDHR